MKAWLVFALLSAIFAGASIILAKVGIKNVHSNYATAIRTAVIVIFSFFIALFTNSLGAIGKISSNSVLFIILAGASTCLSWICFFFALKYGDAAKVSSIDKFSIVLTILLSTMILGEPFTQSTLIGIAGLTMGVAFMVGIPRRAYMKDVTKKNPNAQRVVEEQKVAPENKVQDYETLAIIEGEGKVISRKPIMKNFWIVMALLSALFASLTSIFTKVGMQEMSSTLSVFMRTTIVLGLMLMVVFFQRKSITFKIDLKSFLFMIISGIASGLSLIFYASALKNGNVSLVAPIDKLSVVFASVFAWTVLKEKMTMSALGGLVLIVLGTLMLLMP